MHYTDILANKFIHFSLVYSLLILHTSHVICCRIVDSSVKCSDASDLKREFRDLSQNLSHQSKDFKDLEVWSPIDEIPENVFFDIKFENIWIYNSNNLTRIHTMSFLRTEYKIKSFICYQNFVSRLRNDPPDYDLYKAVSALVNLEELYLSLRTHDSHEIPDWAFQPVGGGGHQQRLRFVEWYGYYTITRIGAQIVFLLPNITQLVFKHTVIKSISAHAFLLPDTDRDQIFNLTFHNTSLTENSFELGVFANTWRRIKLDLTNNKLATIRQDIFEPFFALNEYNFMVLQGNPLNCSDIEPFRWLFKRRQHYKKRISKAYCSNGTELWKLRVGCDITTTTVANSETTGHWISSTILQSTEVTDRTDTETATEVTNRDATRTDEPELDTESEFPTDCDCPDCPPDIDPPDDGDDGDDDPNDGDGDGDGENNNGDGDNGDEESASAINDELLELIEATKDENNLNTSEELKQVVDEIQVIRLTMDSMTALNYEMAFNLTNNMLKVLSNVLNQNNAWLKTMAEERTGVAAQVLNEIEMTSFFLTCNKNNHNKTIVSLANDNIVVNLYKNYSQDIIFEANNSSIVIPKEVLIRDTNNPCENSSFAALIKKLDNYLGRGLHSGQSVNTELVSFSMINSSDVVEFEDGVNIKISMAHRDELHFGDEMICVYWDFLTMSWSDKGCQIVRDLSNRGLSVCLCNHLTNFAALMDMSGREKDDPSKSILTITFCGLSIVCLLLTVVLLLLPQQNSANTITSRLVRTRTLITINLALMLIMADLLIIFGMDRISNKPVCRAVSVLLLYSLLASFSWMVLEGYHLYRMTVHIFVTNSHKRFLFCVGYGLPVVIIVVGFLGIWLQRGILLDALTGDYFCWISSYKYPSNIWLIIGPASFAILFNIAMMIVLMRRVVESNKNNRDNRSGILLKQIFGVTSLLFNLGITWISFLLYLGQLGHYFSYVFIVLNGSQGIFIFIYHSVIVISQRRKALMAIKMTLSQKWSTRTIQTIG